MQVKTIAFMRFASANANRSASVVVGPASYEAFQKDGAIVVAQDNIRVRLAPGTTNGITGAKTPPAAPGALPKQTYIGGSITLEVGGRRAELTHVTNAHTDGDTWIYFADANVLCTGDTMNNTKRYQTIDFANGGDIRVWEQVGRWRQHRRIGAGTEEAPPAWLMDVVAEEADRAKRLNRELDLVTLARRAALPLTMLDRALFQLRSNSGAGIA